ncbi:MAG: LemA family protein [Ignavibacteriae bacterium]|nr:LemA family protein [Ignavibacteriota bacterium]
MKSRAALMALVIVGVLAVCIIGVFLWGMGIYNSLVSLDEQVSSSWSQVESQYQRRADLIPNLVNTVKGFAAQEREVLLGVTEARAKVSQVTVTKDVLDDPATFSRFQAAQDQFSSAISRLLAVAENYPILKSNENFLALQTQIEGTENRIAVERRRFNEVVQQFNTAIRRFPAAFIANMSGFREKQYFKAREGAEATPEVKF